jgi:predicted peptidase
MKDFAKQKLWILVAFNLLVINGNAQNVTSPDYTTNPKKPWETKFDAFEFKVFKENNHSLPYRFYSPVGVVKRKKYPLVIFFHGAGEKGFDNRSQFQRFDPVPFWLKYPCFVLAPECPARTKETSNAESVWVDTPFGADSHKMKKDPTWPMQLAISLIRQVMSDKKIDRDRIYVTGLSMGGFATWEILQRNSGWFAAAIPVCGGGDPGYASMLTRVSLWVFHGGNDRTVPVRRSQEMVEAVKSAGGNVRYTEYPGVDHDAWSPTYKNPEVWDWLFKQTKKGRSGNN